MGFAGDQARHGKFNQVWIMNTTNKQGVEQIERYGVIVRSDLANMPDERRQRIKCSNTHELILY